MIDISETIVAKSDQLNAIDLIGGPMTIRITRVAKVAGDQPVEIHYEGGEGRPFKPCKSVRRLLIGMWKADANKYIGRSLTLYRDPKVKWAGKEEGGIRISHASHIDGDFKMPLAEAKGRSVLAVVKPLAASPSNAPVVAQPDPALLAEGRMAAERGAAALQAWWGRLSPADKTALKPTLDDELKPTAAKADAAVTDDDDFPGSRPSRGGEGE